MTKKRKKWQLNGHRDASISIDSVVVLTKMVLIP